MSSMHTPSFGHWGSALSDVPDSPHFFSLPKANAASCYLWCTYQFLKCWADQPFAPFQYSVGQPPFISKKCSMNVYSFIHHFIFLKSFFVFKLQNCCLVWMTKFATSRAPVSYCCEELALAINWLNWFPLDQCIRCGERTSPATWPGTKVYWCAPIAF